VHVVSVEDDDEKRCNKSMNGFGPRPPSIEMLVCFFSVVRRPAIHKSCKSASSDQRRTGFCTEEGQPGDRSAGGKGVGAIDLELQSQTNTQHKTHKTARKRANRQQTTVNRLQKLDSGHQKTEKESDS
jgi:hypothetical protein